MATNTVSKYDPTSLIINIFYLTKWNDIHFITSTQQAFLVTMQKAQRPFSVS